MKTINKKITGYKVTAESNAPEPLEVIQEEELKTMHESLKRPDVLYGATYKIKTPLSEHALYITINDYILNEGTDKAQKHPYEIFINSKNLEHFQWVIALTRIASAVFRKGGDVTFLVEELEAIFDPKGGYFKKGKYVPSIVAEIGLVIKQHFIAIGLIKEEVDLNMEAFKKEKREQYDQKVNTLDIKKHTDNTITPLEAINIVKDILVDSGQGLLPNQWPNGSTLCSKCRLMSVVLMDGCKTCLNCGDSKCG